jgi:hypothetical protein
MALIETYDRGNALGRLLLVGSLLLAVCFVTLR